METVYIIYHIETQKEERITQREAIKRWGKTEWKEIKAGNLPHIVASKA